MEIERINENTIKFYISYIDIENRGFQKEEIWYNRERGEQLFWQMMEELNYKEDFSFEGPLWIQVQALEKGLEVIVTRAQLSANGESVELPIDDDKTIEVPIEEKVEQMFDQNLTKQEELIHEEVMWMVVRFAEFEDVIQLSHAFNASNDYIVESLYHYKDKYFLCIEFMEEMFNEEEQEDIICQILEYSTESDESIHVIEEYGKTIFADHALTEAKKYFPL